MEIYLNKIVIFVNKIKYYKGGKKGNRNVKDNWHKFKRDVQKRIIYNAFNSPHLFK